MHHVHGTKTSMQYYKRNFFNSHAIQYEHDIHEKITYCAISTCSITVSHAVLRLQYNNSINNITNGYAKEITYAASKVNITLNNHETITSKKLN